MACWARTESRQPGCRAGRWPAARSPGCRRRCPGPLAEQLADRHQVVVVGLQHRDELVDQVDRAGVGVVQQHHRTGLDLGHQHVSAGRGVRVVDPVERDDVPEDSGQTVLCGLLVDRVVGQAAGRPPQLGRHTGGGGDRIAGPGQLGRDIGGGNVVMLGCSQVWLPISMPASTTRLAPRRVGGDLVADLEERRLGLVGGQNAQQPVGVGGRAVVERQRDAFVLCAVDDVVGVSEPDVPGERTDRDDDGGCQHTGDRAPVPPRKGVWSPSRHGR